MNHENSGFDCPECAWPDDRKGLRIDICENGIKHVTCEMTRKRVVRLFFATHTVTELAGWTDFALEDVGRLTEPMSNDAGVGAGVDAHHDDEVAGFPVGEIAGAFAGADRGLRRAAGGVRVGSVAGYMPELNVLCPIEDYPTQSGQQLMKATVVDVAKHQR